MTDKHISVPQEFLDFCRNKKPDRLPKGDFYGFVWASDGCINVHLNDCPSLLFLTKEQALDLEPEIKKFIAIGKSFRMGRFRAKKLSTILAKKPIRHENTRPR